MPFRLRSVFRAGFAGALLVLLGFVLWARWSPYPELEDFRFRPVSTRIRDRDGRLLRVLPLEDGLYREFLPLDRIPRRIRLAFLTGEDRRFYLHPGIDPLAVLRSAADNLRAGRTVSGASTVTMQLARIIAPHGGGLRGKIREAADALRLEVRLVKRDILELWLNSVPFSYRTEGIASACRTFFGKTPDAAGPAEALLLAVIPRRPAAYVPGENPERAATAAFGLAGRTRSTVSRGELLAAARAAVSVSRTAAYPSEAPHFVRMVAGELRGATETAAGSGSPAPPVPDLFTSLDLDLQRRLEAMIGLELERHRSNRISNAAGVVLDNRTGEILAYVGSGSSDDNTAGSQIDAVTVRNQPGSCLKPFLYALALERGFRPNDIIPDLPTDFGSTQVYVPMNFDRRFRGPVRLRVALASSLNVPAVALLARLGVREFEEFLVTLGFDSIRDQAGSLGTGLALGNAEVSLLELTRAFAVFPRGGEPLRIAWRKQSRTEPGPAGEKSGEKRRLLVSPYTAAVITDILSDGAARYPGFGPGGPFATAFPAMFKTGTADQFQNIWAVGATPEVSAGVWMGNLTGETVIGRTGSSLPARVVAAVLASARSDARPAGNFSLPDAVRRQKICTLSGMAAGPSCPGTAWELLPRGEALPPCDWHAGDGRVRYPSEYSRWLAEGGRSGEGGSSGALRIVSPNDGSRYYIDPAVPADRQAIRLETTGMPSTGASVYLDGGYAGELEPDGSVILPLRRGRHRIRIEADGSTDEIGIEVR